MIGNLLRDFQGCYASRTGNGPTAKEHFINIPELQSERLQLRGHRLTDRDAVVKMWMDPLVTKYILSGRPSSPTDSWYRLLRYAGHWALLGFGFWVVQEKKSGAFVGEVGFADFARDISPPITVPEMGWSLRSEFHGKGYATEAIKLALNWAKANLPAKHVACMIDPENLPSLRVAEKCGFNPAGQSMYEGKPVKIFDLPL